MSALLLALLAPAHAIDFSQAQWGPSMGPETVTNDPFLYRTGWRTGVHFAPVPWAEVGLAAVWYPIMGQGGENDPDWKPLSKQLLLENSVSPDIAKLTGQIQLSLKVLPVRVALDEHWETGLGLIGGFALFGTQDDLVALQNDGPDAVATQTQVHPGAVGGFFWQVRQRYVGFRLRFESDAYIETVNSTYLEMKHNEMLGLEVLCWF